MYVFSGFSFILIHVFLYKLYGNDYVCIISLALVLLYTFHLLLVLIELLLNLIIDSFICEIMDL